MSLVRILPQSYLLVFYAPRWLFVRGFHVKETVKYFFINNSTSKMFPLPAPFKSACSPRRAVVGRGCLWDDMHLDMSCGLYVCLVIRLQTP